MAINESVQGGNVAIGNLVLQREISKRFRADERCTFHRTALDRHLSELEAQSDELLRRRSFSNVLRLCIETRRTGNTLHSAIVMTPDADATIRMSLERFVGALDRAAPAIEEVVAAAVGPDRHLAEHYRSSIGLRGRWSKAALAGDSEAIVHSLMDDGERIVSALARLQSTENSAVDAAEQTLAFVYRWLAHKLVLVHAELKAEGGPWAESTHEHSEIAGQVRDVSEQIVQQYLGQIAQFDAEVDRMTGTSRWHRWRLHRLLDELESSVLAPLRRMAAKAPHSGQEAPVPFHDRLESEAKQCIEKLRDTTERLLIKTVEAIERLVCVWSGCDDLSVLLSHERGLWFAECVERSLVAQSTTLQGALDNLALTAELDYSEPADDPSLLVELKDREAFERSAPCLHRPSILPPNCAFFVRMSSVSNEI